VTILQLQQLHDACFTGNTAQLAALLAVPGVRSAVNGRVSSDGLRPLHIAIQRRHVECVRQLLAVGARPEEPDPRGATALHMAVAAPVADAQVCRGVVPMPDFRGGWGGVRAWPCPLHNVPAPPPCWAR
jgi:hypothetical protein